jgi:hypothetical protein
MLSQHAHACAQAKPCSSSSECWRTANRKSIYRAATSARKTTLSRCSISPTLPGSTTSAQHLSRSGFGSILKGLAFPYELTIIVVLIVRSSVSHRLQEPGLWLSAQMCRWLVLEVSQVLQLPYSSNSRLWQYAEFGEPLRLMSRSRYISKRQSCGKDCDETCGVKQPGDKGKHLGEAALPMIHTPSPPCKIHSV